MKEIRIKEVRIRASFLYFLSTFLFFLVFLSPRINKMWRWKFYRDLKDLFFFFFFFSWYSLAFSFKYCYCDKCRKHSPLEVKSPYSRVESFFFYLFFKEKQLVDSFFFEGGSGAGWGDLYVSIAVRSHSRPLVSTSCPMKLPN